MEEKMDDTRKRMIALNREAELQRLEEHRPLINARRRGIDPLMEQIKLARPRAREIVPEIQELVASVRALPWGPGVPMEESLRRALNEANSLLAFGGKTLLQQIDDLLNTRFTDNELATPLCDPFFSFVNLGNCVVAAPGALRKLKGVIEWEKKEAEGRIPAPITEIDPPNRDGGGPAEIKILSNLPHDLSWTNTSHVRVKKGKPKWI
jgi:hypothetical protein